MNIFKRLIGSLIDKIILVFLFGFLFFMFLPYSAGDLGVFIGAILNESTASYPWIEAAANNAYSLERIDHFIVYSFTIMNMFYYFICEQILKASIGKYIMGGRCVDIFDNKVGMILSFYRAIVLGIFIFIAIQFRAFLTIISYTTTIIIYFFIIDIPVLFRKRSLIDIVTGTYYKDAKSITQNNVEGEDSDSEKVEKQSNNKDSCELSNNSCESDNSCKSDNIITVNCVGSNEMSFIKKENDDNILSDKNGPMKEKEVQKKNKFLVYIIPLFLCICLLSSVVINKTLPLKYLLNFNEYYTERFINYDNEKISVAQNSTYFSQPNKIGYNEIEDMENWGPIPNGNPISMFIGTGDSVYYYKHYYQRPCQVPIYNGNNWWNRSIVGWKNSWMWDYDWRKVPYNYTYTLTVFKNDDTSVSNDKELVYQFKSRLYDYNNWTFPISKLSAKINWKGFKLNTPEDKIGVTYSAYYKVNTPDSIENVVRSIFYANNRAYMLEIRSPHHAINIANNILQSFTTNYMKDYKENSNNLYLVLLLCGTISIMLLIGLIVYLYHFKSYIYDGRSTISIRKYYISMLSIYIMLASFIAVSIYYAYMKYVTDFYHRDLAIYCIMIYTLFVLSLIVSFSISNKIWKSNNKTAQKLSIFILCMTIINTVIFYLDVNSIFEHKIAYDEDWWFYFKPIFYTSIANYIVLPCIVSLPNTKPSFSFLIPKWGYRYLSNRNVSNKEKRYLLKFLIIPLFTICMIPFGAYVLLYVIPTLLILVVVLEAKVIAKRTLKQQKKDKTAGKTDTIKAVFKDYYLILDVKSDASDDCIDRAFNKAMAKYNLNRGSKIFSKQYVLNLQEAYRVLSSTERLKPEYDAEYELYRKSDKQVYEYTNINVCRDIKTIQEEIHHNNVRHNNVIDYLLKKNAIVLSITIFLIGLLATYAFINVKSHLSYSHSYRYVPTNNYDEYQSDIDEDFSTSELDTYSSDDEY